MMSSPAGESISRDGNENPTSIAYQVAAEMNLFRRRYEEAIAQAERAITLDPNDPTGYDEMAYALIFAGRPAQAMDHIKRMRVLNRRKRAFPLNLYGLVHISIGQYEEAVNSFERSYYP